MVSDLRCVDSVINLRSVTVFLIEIITVPVIIKVHHVNGYIINNYWKNRRVLWED
jgi:hypothetical protein